MQVCALTHLMKTPLTKTFIWTFHAREAEFQLHFGLKVCSVCHSCRNCAHGSGLPPCKVLSCMHGAIPLCQKMVKSPDSFVLAFKLTWSKSINIEMRDVRASSEEATGTGKTEAEYVAGDSP